VLQFPDHLCQHNLSEIAGLQKSKSHTLKYVKLNWSRRNTICNVQTTFLSRCTKIAICCNYSVDVKLSVLLYEITHIGILLRSVAKHG
jgi:hypothetical protein